MLGKIHYLTRLIFLLTSACIFSAASVSSAEEPRPVASNAKLERRVHELEAIVQRLQEDLRKSNSAGATTMSAAPGTIGAPPSNVESVLGNSVRPGGAPTLANEAPGASAAPTRDGSTAHIPAGWDNGFFIQSEDKTYSLRITGQIQGDYREFVRSGDTTDIDNFLVRRARLGIEATVAKFYEFRLLPDFGQASPTIQDAYLNIHYWDEFQIEIGKFKQPLSYEQLIQDRFVPTVERSIIDQLVPARDEGLMLHGQKLFGDRLDYAFAVSNGEINGSTDVNDSKDVSARIVVRPFVGWESFPLARGVQIGVSGGGGIEQESISPASLKTPGTVPWFSYNSTVRADGHRTRLSPEASYFYHSLGLAAQYYREEQQMRPNSSGAAAKLLVDVPMNGFYVMGTYLITGEERTSYSQAIVPRANFDPCHPFSCPGAWEAVARVSHLELGEEVFAPGMARLADPTRFAKGATELTLGFNWYFNPWVRAQFNWEHSWFESAVRLGSGSTGLLNSQDALLTRLQVIF